MVMATIEIGPYHDYEIDRPRTIAIEVPDEGELPELPNEFQQIQYSTGQIVPFNWMSSHEGINIPLDEVRFHYALRVFYIEERAEWVCFYCHTFYPPYGSFIPPNQFFGPFMVTQTVMRFVARHYQVPDTFAISPEMKRCHPDIFEQMRLDYNE